MVYAKPPFGGPKQVLKYLARYTHRVAIANSRLLALEDDDVIFRWQDYARGNRPRVLQLEGVEFLRRFLLHRLPSGFMRIRHYGFLANRGRREKLLRIRTLLGDPSPPRASPETAPSEAKPGPWCCPKCREGTLRWIPTLVPQPPTSRAPPSRQAWQKEAS